MSASRGPLGILGKLPKEIRDLIYGFALAAGSTSITRASKYLYTDTKQKLLQHGVYRVRVMYHKDLENHQFCFHVPQSPSNECLATIQNFDIQFQPYKDCGDHCGDHCAKHHDGPCFRRQTRSLYTMLTRLLLPVERHKHCHIKFAFGTFVKRHAYNFDTPNVISFLRQFEAVNLELVCTEVPDPHRRNTVVETIISLMGPNVTVVLTHVVEDSNHKFVSASSSTLWSHAK